VTAPRTARSLRLRATGRGLALVVVFSLFASAGDALGATTPAALEAGTRILRRAANAYRAMPAFLDTARYVVHVPGAPPHEESQEFGVTDSTAAWIRMPGLYVMQEHGRVLYLLEEGRLEPHLEMPVARGLQAAVDSAFGGQGAPLAPAPLLLRRAGSDAELRDAFRMRLLGSLKVSGARNRMDPNGRLWDEVELSAANGRARARFDHREGWLGRVELAFVPGRGADTIRAVAEFRPHSDEAPEILDAARIARGKRVARLGELSGSFAAPPRALWPATRFRLLTGASTTLAEAGGDFVALEFWATWCAPCRAAIPHVLEFADWARDSAPQVRVVLVNTEEETEDLNVLRPRIQRYLLDTYLNLTVPCWVDSAAIVHRKFGGGLPLTLLLDSKGEVLEKYTGLRDDLADRLKQRIRAELAPAR
jgi:thiol-disulfide isomerase/thioredoxin